MTDATRDAMAAVAAMAGEFHGFLAAIDDSDPSFDVEATAAKLERSGFGRKPLFSALIAEAGGEVGAGAGADVGAEAGEDVAGEAIGYALYNIGFWADTLQGMVLLTDLFVRQAWRSRGVGKALMDRLAEIGKDEGCEIVVWSVWRKNAQARRFYERLGAEAIDDETLMAWPI